MGDLTFTIVVAVAENGVIGANGKLPWRLKSDLKRFKALTLNHPVIMGRKTFQSIGTVLEKRDNIVVSRSQIAPVPRDILLAGSLVHALQIAKECAAKRSVTEAFVIGGAGLFAEALPSCQRLHLTIVHANPDGDTVWHPPSEGFRETYRTSRAASELDEYAVTDVVMERLPRA